MRPATFENTKTLDALIDALHFLAFASYWLLFGVIERMAGRPVAIILSLVVLAVVVLRARHRLRAKRTLSNMRVQQNAEDLD